jgi:Mg2+ and Co2+ transporter CorA
MEHLLKMKSKTIKFRDPVVENVVDKFVSRSDVGFAKYGQSMHNERTTKQKDLAGYLNDIQEELMDAVLYIQAAREELQDLSEEALIDRHRADKYDAPMAYNMAQDWDDETEN